MTEREDAVQLIALMGHVEGIAEENRFVPPVEVDAIDRDGQVWSFEYSPAWDSVDMLNVAAKLPLNLRFRDANGAMLEVDITDWTLRPEWLKRFLQ